LLEGKGYNQAARRGNAIGSLQVQTHGDNDGYPTREELNKYYLENEVEE
jgi:Sugar kinases, ribokinase family